MGVARPYRLEFLGEIVLGELVQQQHFLALAVLGAADQRDVALAGPDAREGDPHRIDPGAFFAHEGARGAGDAMDDRYVAGEQIGELRQKQGRAQIAHQPLVEEELVLARLRQAAENAAVGGEIALAAARGHDHVHAAEQLCLALGPGAVEREAGGIGADPLPRLHLPLVALLRDLGIEIHWRQRMDDVGRESRALDMGLAGVESLPMRIRPLAETGYDADAGDPGLAGRFNHARTPPPGTRCAAPLRPCWCGISDPERP